MAGYRRVYPELWAGPWYASAGVDIRYLTRSQALSAGLPPGSDWSLLDGRRVIIHEFNPGLTAEAAAGIMNDDGSFRIDWSPGAELNRRAA